MSAWWSFMCAVRAPARSCPKSHSYFFLFPYFYRRVEQCPPVGLSARSQNCALAMALRCPASIQERFCTFQWCCIASCQWVGRFPGHGPSLYSLFTVLHPMKRTGRHWKRRSSDSCCHQSALSCRRCWNRSVSIASRTCACFESTHRGKVLCKPPALPPASAINRVGDSSAALEANVPPPHLRRDTSPELDSCGF